MNNRQKAIKWWGSLPIYEGELNKVGYCENYYGNRSFHTLTGREVEHIWLTEKIERKEAVLWWKGLSITQKSIFRDNIQLADEISLLEAYRIIIEITPK